MRNAHRRFFVVGLIVCCSLTTVWAQDEVELEGISIIGNRELPKALYIVPWKDSDLGDLQGRPAESLLDESLEPVDRDVFRRELEYYAIGHSAE